LGFQERRGKVTDDTVSDFMKVRPLEWQGNPKLKRTDLVVPVEKKDTENSEAPAEGDGKMSKNQLKKILKQQELEKRKADKAKEKEEKAAAAGS
jgi:tryptophanyl-tRNA synthetase